MWGRVCVCVCCTLSYIFINTDYRKKEAVESGHGGAGGKTNSGDRGGRRASIGKGQELEWGSGDPPPAGPFYGLVFV